MYTTTTFIGDNENYPMRNAVKRASVPKDYIYKTSTKPAEFVVINPAPVKEEKKEKEEKEEKEKKEPEVKAVTENISPAPVEEVTQEEPVTEKKARKPRGKKAPKNQAEDTENQ